MGLIENKEIYKEFNKQVEIHKKNKYKYNINDLLAFKELPDDYILWREKDKQIEIDFQNKLIEEYSIDEKIINFANNLADMSDNGCSFEDIEKYIILIKEFLLEGGWHK